MKIDAMYESFSDESFSDESFSDEHEVLNYTGEPNTYSDVVTKVDILQQVFMTANISEDQLQDILN